MMDEDKQLMQPDKNKKNHLLGLGIFNSFVLVSLDEDLTLIDANEDFFRMLDESRDSFSARGNSFRNILSPILSKKLREKLTQSLEPTVDQFYGYIQRLDGKHRNVQVSICPFNSLENKEDNGENKFCRLAILDMTNLDAYRFDHYMSSDKYGEIINDASHISFEYNFETDIIYFSNIYQELFGSEPVINNFRKRLEQGEYIDELTHTFSSFFIQMKEIEGQDLPENCIETQTHGKRWYSAQCWNIVDSQGNPQFVRGMIEDIDRFKKSQNMLIEKLKIDEMTGLYTKTATEQIIRQTIGSSKGGTMDVFLMIDVDNFKLVNDTMGHMAGDAVLKQIASELSKIFRKDDIVGRAGGDEFHVYLRNVPSMIVLHKKVQSVCDDICALFKKSNLPVNISLSIGVSIVSQNIEFDELYRQADVALYHAKSMGKNRYEIFGQLSSEESLKSQKTDQKNIPDQIVNKNIRNTLISDVLDILFSTYNPIEKLDDVLEFIGNALGIDRTVIFEKSPDYKRISITHEWANKPERRFAHLYQNVDVEKDVFFPEVQDSSGIFYCSDVSLLDASKSKIVKNLGLKSYVQCNLTDGKNVLGYICFESHSGLHTWSQVEIDALLLLARVIAESLRLMLSSQMLERSYGMTKDILNNLLDRSICVISQETRRILYFNQTFSNHVKGVAIGKLCHEQLWECNQRCDFCPVKQNSREIVRSTISGLVFDEKHTELLDVTYTPFMWEGTQPAYIIEISKHVLSDSERQQQEQLISFAKALSSVSCYVIDVDINAATYHVLQKNKQSMLSFKDAGMYEDFEQFMLTCAHPNYHGNIKKSFSLEHLREFSRSGKKGEISEEYELLSDLSQNPWYRNSAYIYHFLDGSTHFVILAQDITVQHNKQLEQVRDKKTLFDALQSFFDEIFRVNLDSQKVELFYKGANERSYDPSLSYDEIVKYRVEHNVYADDIKPMLEFLDRENIKHELTSNKFLEREFRTFIDGKIIWKQLVIKPASQGDHLFMLRDITKIKVAEINYLNVARKYLDGLRHGYSEIFEVDVNKDYVCDLSNGKNVLNIHDEIDGHFSSSTAFIAEHLIPEEQREAFIEFFSSETIIQQFQKTNSMQLQYRMRMTEQEEYRWYETLIMPMGTDGKYFFLSRDIQEQKLEEIKKHEIEKSYFLALQASYTEILEIDLKNNCINKFHDRGYLVQTYGIDDNDYHGTTLKIAQTLIVSEDREIFLAHYNEDNIRQTCGGTVGKLYAEYRIEQCGEIHWFSSLILPLDQEKDRYIVLSRDINDQKIKELAAQKIKQNYLMVMNNSNIVLRELDLNANTLKRMFNMPNLFGDISVQGKDYWQDTLYLAENFVHQEDKQKFLDFYKPQAIEQGPHDRQHPYCIEYRVKMNHEMRWVSSVLLPFEDEKGMYLMMNRDIDAKKREELNRDDIEHTYMQALSSSYSQVWSINLSENSLKKKYSVPSFDETLNEILSPLNTYLETVKILAEQVVVLEDKQIFLDHYDPEHIRQLCKENEPTYYTEYRLNFKSIGVQWLSSIIIPVKNKLNSYLILTRNINEQKQKEIIQQQIEQNYWQILRNNYFEIFEFNIDKDTGKAIVGTLVNTENVHGKGIYKNVRYYAAHYVHPEDREKFIKLYSENELREYFSKEERLYEIYRILDKDKKYRWIEACIIHLNGDDFKFVVLHRDITREKELEQQKIEEDRRYFLTVRNAYLEMFEINLLDDTPKVIYSANDLLISIDFRMNSNIHSVAQDLIHPDDKENFLERLNGQYLMKCFNQEKQTKIIANYRRLGRDGGYYWVQATAIPLAAKDGDDANKALLLLRNMSDTHDLEINKQLAERYDTALRSIYDRLFVINYVTDEVKLVYKNSPLVINLDSLSLSQTINAIGEQVINPQYRKDFYDYLNLDQIKKRFSDGREYAQFECLCLKMDGVYSWYSYMLIPMKSDLITDDCFLLFVLDIDKRKRSEELIRKNIVLEQQRDAEARYRIIVEQLGTLVFEWNTQECDCYCSPELKQRFDGQYLQGKSILTCWLEDEVIYGEDLDAYKAFMKKAQQLEPYAEIIVRVRLRQGQYIWCKIAFTCTKNDDNAIYRYIGTVNDVDEARRSLLSLQYRAEYDTLTGLYNMQSFYTHAQKMLSENPVDSCYIVRLDIDRFKVVNDLYGLEEGDNLLRFIADALKKLCSHDAVIARFSNDIFYLSLVWSKQEVLAMIEQMLSVLATYPISSHFWLSFGICLVDNRHTPINVLCDCALLAQKTIKGNSFMVYAFYDDKLRQRILEEKQIENDMHDALSNGEFILFFQPKVNMATRQIVGCEALVRWNHPVKGLIEPDKFIPLFERNGFINLLDEYVWEQTCLFIRRWLDDGLSPLAVSINVSRVHVYNSTFGNKLEELVNQYQIPHELLEIELTESAFLKNVKGLFDIVNHLRQQGFVVAMDDFGSGYSSLNMLKEIPVDVIKLDKVFLSKSQATDRSRNVVHYSISLAEKMKIKVIAEGVETQEQADFLLSLGCNCAQGYLYSPPIKEELLRQLIQEGTLLGDKNSI